MYSASDADTEHMTASVLSFGDPSVTPRMFVNPRLSCDKFQFGRHKNMRANLSRSRVSAPVVHHCYLAGEEKV